MQTGSTHLQNNGTVHFHKEHITIKMSLHTEKTCLNRLICNLLSILSIENSFQCRQSYEFLPKSMGRPITPTRATRTDQIKGRYSENSCSLRVGELFQT